MGDVLAELENKTMGGGVCKCEMEIDVKKEMAKPVYMYYGLTNFYQNHRRYVKSRDEKQLLGNVEAKPSDDCAPFATDPEPEKPYVPCGAIANSLFNDVISISKGEDTITLEKTGIAWESDKKYKFQNPDYKSKGYTTLEDYLKNTTAKPKDWIKNLWELDTNETNNGLLNEDLIVWMRTAAFPNFRKLYRKINHTDAFENGMPKGNYTIEIEYNYRVKSFSGTKSIVLSQISILGGKNSFLPISYIIVGVLCLLIGVVFLFIHVKYGKLSG